MDTRKRILELRLWSFFGRNREAISPDVIAVLEQKSEYIRQLAKLNGEIDTIVSRATQGLFANDDEECADVLEAVARDMRSIVKESIKRNG